MVKHKQESMYYVALPDAFVGDGDVCVNYLSFFGQNWQETGDNQVVIKHICSLNDGTIQSVSNHVQELRLVLSLLIFSALCCP